MESTTHDPRVSPPRRRGISHGAPQRTTATTDSGHGLSGAFDSAARERAGTHVSRPSMVRWVRQSIVADLRERYGHCAVDRHWLRVEDALDRALRAPKVVR